MKKKHFIIDEDIASDIAKIVNSSQDDLGYKKYSSNNHFVRCAIIKLIREEKEK